MFGTLFVMGLVLSFFQDGFTSSLRKELLQMKTKDRLGMVGAFILIDVNDSGTVDLEEFRDFVKELNPRVKDKNIEDIFDSINTSLEKEPSLDLEEFVTGVEQSSEIRLENEDFTLYTLKEFLVQYENSNKVGINTWMERSLFILDCARCILYPVVASRYFRVAVLLGIFLQIWVLAMYGTSSNLEVLDILNGVLVLINVLDVSFMIFVYRRAVIFLYCVLQV